MLQWMQRHRGVRSQRRDRRCRRRSSAGGNTPSSITQTHRTRKTRHALNARHRVAACNASSMRANPHLTPPFPCTTRAPAVWMGRTCKRSRDGAPCCQGACKQDQGKWSSYALQRSLYNPVAALARRAPTFSTLTFLPFFIVCSFVL